MDNKRLFLIDGFALIYRAYFAFSQRPLIADGFNVSGIFGFFSSLFSLLEKENPEYIAIVLDSSEPTFRHKMYDEYKATREKMPDDLTAQLPVLFDMIKTTNIPTVVLAGFEADDLIAKIAKEAETDDFETYIYSSDKDLCQLVNDKTFLYDPKQNEIFDKNKVFEKFDVYPEQITDYLALVGDASDNVPGVPKVGKKTAADLLGQYKTLDDLYNNVELVTKKAVKASLIENKDKAYLSKELVVLNTSFDLDIDWESYKMGDFNRDAMVKYFEKYKMRALIKTLNDKFSSPTDKKIELFETIESNKNKYSLLKPENLVALVPDNSTVSLYLITEPENSRVSDIKGICVSDKKGRAYLSLVNEEVGVADDLFAEVSKRESEEDFILKLKPLFENETIKFIIYDFKNVNYILNKYDIYIKNCIFDPMVAHYVLKAHKADRSLEKIVMDYLNYRCIDTATVFGSGRQKAVFDNISRDNLLNYYCERADTLRRVYEKMDSDLSKELLLKNVYYDLEHPLISVLLKMEIEGIKLDIKRLNEIDDMLCTEISSLKKKIFEIVGDEFNPDSPKQLNEILSDKMGLKLGKKGKSGQRSTDSSVLEKLKDDGNEIAIYLLTYRELTKLRNTYSFALMKLAKQDVDNRVHTTFNQIIASTGRLSSKDPNLQNIPIKTETGEKLREVFVSKEGYNLVAADYSQIELRIMAHYCQDEDLIDAFNKGEDIHKKTAAVLFGVDIADVTKEMRIKAKTANFSVLYGKSKYGLSEDLKISFKEASEFIDTYFTKFSKIKNFIDTTKEYVKKNGYVTSISGRKREFPEVRSENANVKNHAFRAAVNMPIQGSSADIIKEAMIKLDNDNYGGYDARMLLQVHDELIFEVREEQTDEFSNYVKDVMENVHKLSVPLDVNVGVGKNWLDAH